LPRGGVPVAFEVARALDAPLDVLLVRKIGAPAHEEFGIGAVVDGNPPVAVVDDMLVRLTQASPAYVEATIRRETAEIERRRRLYVGDRVPSAPAGRTVILVDDGIATGGTARAALRTLARAGARKRVLAVPVAPADSLEELREDADEVVCLSTPEPFIAVGVHYDDFCQTSDEEVVRLLHESRRD
jgi:putative phosphoribosyl transferase